CTSFGSVGLTPVGPTTSCFSIYRETLSRFVHRSIRQISKISNFSAGISAVIVSWITFRLDKHIGELCHTGWMRSRS
ncbi:hypothetical protein ABLN73_17400, partial [Mycobacterium tuberculosis]